MANILGDIDASDLKPHWRQEFARRVEIARGNDLGIAKNWTRVREKATNARRALRELVRTLPPNMAGEFRDTLTRLELLEKAEGPDPREKPGDWLYAFLAWTFIEQCSTDKPVTTQFGNVHHAARWLFEAATGEQATDGRFLRSIAEVKKFREGRTQAPLVRTRFPAK
jgi:hypothetical protein